MGFFEDVKKSFNEGRQRAIDESYRRRKQEEKVNIPVELVEPNGGRFVTLKITEKNEFLKGVYMKQLSAYARSIKNIYPNAVLTMYDDRVTLEMNSWIYVKFLDTFFHEFIYFFKLRLSS